MRVILYFLLLLSFTSCAYVSGVKDARTHITGTTTGQPTTPIRKPPTPTNAPTVNAAKTLQPAIANIVRS